MRSFKVSVFIVCATITALSRAESNPEPADEKKVSLIEVAPMIYYMAARKWSFYGDAQTSGGRFGERSRLLGNLGGDRDAMVDNGIFLDWGVTQFAQGNTTGGLRDSPDPRTNGSTDLYLWLDTGKLNWWSGGAIFAHWEANWGTDMNGDVDSLLPANWDAAMPSTNNTPNADLSELYWLQALPAGWLLALGKLDFAAWADTNTFANNERTQFSSIGLVNNAIAGVFFPYTANGGFLAYTSPNQHHNVDLVFAKQKASVGQTGFDDLDNSDNSYAIQYTFTTEVDNKPGHYLIAGAYSTKELDKFEVSRGVIRRSELVDEIQLPQVVNEDENYTVIGNFHQFLWVKDGATSRRSGTPVGAGIFARAGWSPDDRNVVDQFYSFGLGGYGMLIPGRDKDNWGIGWSGSHISDDLRGFVPTLDSWEHNYEVFYNFAVAPSVYLTLNAQAIEPANGELDTAVAVGARLQVDF